MGTGKNIEESKGQNFNSELKESKKRKKSQLQQFLIGEDEQPVEQIKYPMEFLFSDLLDYLMQYVTVITGAYYNGMWRSQKRIFTAFNKHIHHFNCPDLVEKLWKIAFDLSFTG